MKTNMMELNLNDMEMVNGGGLASKLLHVVGTVTAATVGFVAGPAAAVAVGLGFVGLNEAIDRVTQ